MKIIKKTFQYGEHTVTIETGKIAKQADGAVMVSMGGTMVLVTACAKKTADAAKDFLPLTVNYQERYYANGKIPGGFMKREGRPSTLETLTSRLIDRPLRPLFPEGFYNEVQVVATLMSMDPEISGDIPALIGASAALAISGVPFNGPLGAACVGYKDGTFILNPTTSQLKESELNLIVAGSEDAILMVESEAKELPENVMLDAVIYGHDQMRTVISVIKELAAEVGKQPMEWQPIAENTALIAELNAFVELELSNIYKIINKQERKDKINQLRDSAIAKFSNPDEKTDPTQNTIKNHFANIEYRVMRNKVLDEKVRIDGRDMVTVRPIDIGLSILPRTHGSACFTRGETQAIVVATLGTGDDAQIIDIPAGESLESFMLHYNFPPYCTGEVGMVGSPRRREIGHGNLAKRALQAVIPDKSVFPYVLRVVSEITESNGSSSMASVCGTTLALMDAGVPIKNPVAGIAMGLIKEGDRYAVLTDILGDEDHLGDMDFKVAGSAQGVTALQMDIKIAGIDKDIMRTALAQAKDARMHILGLMLEQIPQSREHVSDYAPRIITIKINPEKIRDVIGKGGATIRALVEETGAKIDINDSGEVTIASVDKNAGQAALKRIQEITAEPEVNKIYQGKVVKIMDFGAFVNIMPGRDGLLHISQIANQRVERVEDFLQEGQEVTVKVLEVDRMGKIRLSMKEVESTQN